MKSDLVKTSNNLVQIKNSKAMFKWYVFMHFDFEVKKSNAQIMSLWEQMCQATFALTFHIHLWFISVCSYFCPWKSIYIKTIWIIPVKYCWCHIYTDIFVETATDRFGVSYLGLDILRMMVENRPTFISHVRAWNGKVSLIDIARIN
jgi:hypothetical protein